MPIVLTTSYDPGDNDPGQSYPKAKIIRIEINPETPEVVLIVGHGDDTGGSFARGKGARNKVFRLRDVGATTDYTDFVGQATLDGETLYDAFKRLAYAKVQELEAALAGSVE